MTRRPSRWLLVAALFALSVLYAIWFHGDRHHTAAMLVFVLPPLLMLAGVLAGGAVMAFWAGVLGLLWFSHGVMAAWTRPADSLFAWLEIALSLLVVFSASWPGLVSRFGRKRRAKA